MSETTAGTADPELKAIQSILDALKGLDGEQLHRVLDYVFRRIGVPAPSDPATARPLEPTGDLGVTNSSSNVSPIVPVGVTDIRTLRGQKQPTSDNQMAALVAYYLSDVAPPVERRATIGTPEIEKYFKQAGHPLPKVTRVTLANAAAAGYFDQASRGQYKLNAVGYNLVVHQMGRSGEGESAPRARGRKNSKRKTAGRRARAKKR